MQTWKGFHWDTSFLLVHFCFETASVCIELISVCVESTLHVYQNGETTLYQNKCTPFKSVLDCIAQTMRCTLGSIQHGGQVTRKKVIASYTRIIVALSKKLLYFLKITTRKNFLQMKFDRQGWRCPWRMIFQFRCFWITVTTWYQKRSLQWNPRAWAWECIYHSTVSCPRVHNLISDQHQHSS